MKLTNIIKFIAALLWVLRADLAAQEKEAIGIGERIRVAAPAISHSKLVGTLAALHGDTLFLQKENSTFPSPLAIPLAAITRLEVNRGKGSRGKHVLTGSAIGVLATIPATWIVLKAEGGSEEIEGGEVIVGSLLLSPVGIILGGVVGSLFPHEQWKDRPVDGINSSLLPPSKIQAHERKKGIMFAGGFGAGNTAKSSESRAGFNTTFRLGFNLSRSLILSGDYEINDRRDERPRSTDFVKRGDLFVSVRRPQVFSTRYALISVQANLPEGFFVRSSAGLGFHRYVYYAPMYLGPKDPNTGRPTISEYVGFFSSEGGPAFGLSAGYELIRMRALAFSLEGTYRKSRGEDSSGSRSAFGVQGLVALRF